VRARIVYVLEDFPEEADGVSEDASDQSILDRVLGSYLGPRYILACASVLYGICDVYDRHGMNMCRVFTSDFYPCSNSLIL